MKKEIIVLLLCAALLLSGCGEQAPPPVETVDPYEGMVLVESGYGTQMWVTEYPELPVNPFTAEDFQDGVYTGTDYLVRCGIDVSEHQGEIDWAAVREDDIQFAVIRAGYRGYGEAGSLRQDACFTANMEGARNNGLSIGIYFFSQATDAEEAVQEADYLLELLAPYGPSAFALPIYYDWEAISQVTARTDGMDGESITACAVAFCGRIAAAGYRAGIYAYRNLGYFSYDLRQLQDYSLWIAALGSYPDFYYAHEIWQYSIGGRVSGIGTDVDLDLLFVPAS